MTRASTFAATCRSGVLKGRNSSVLDSEVLSTQPTILCRAVISTRATAYCSESRESGRSMPATIELHESNVDSFLCVAA